MRGRVIRRGTLVRSGLSAEYYTSQPSPTQWVAVATIAGEWLPVARRLLVGTGATEAMAVERLSARFGQLSKTIGRPVGPSDEPGARSAPDRAIRPAGADVLIASEISRRPRARPATEPITICDEHGPLLWCFVQRDGSHIQMDRCRCIFRPSRDCPIDAHRELAVSGAPTRRRSPCSREPADLTARSAAPRTSHDN